MSDLSEPGNAPESEAGAVDDPMVKEAQEEGSVTAVDLQDLSKRLGSRLRSAPGKKRILKLMCALLALVAGAASAQAPGIAPQRMEQSFAGSARLGITALPATDAIATRAPAAPFQDIRVRHRGPGVALMLVGAAGIITGLLIDESLITILGAGTGLVGLYFYLR